MLLRLVSVEASSMIISSKLLNFVWKILLTHLAKNWWLLWLGIMIESVGLAVILKVS